MESPKAGVRAPGLDPDQHALRPVDFTDSPFALALVLGFGTPVGLVGGTIDYSIDPHLALGGGAGVTLGGPEVTGLVRVRPEITANRDRARALVFQGAFSMARYRALDFGDEVPDDVVTGADRAFWLEGDIGYELRSKGGFAFLVAGGIASLLNPSALTCRRGSARLLVSCPHSSYFVPSITLSLGYAL